VLSRFDERFSQGFPLSLQELREVPPEITLKCKTVDHLGCRDRRGVAPQ
jgi:hypothetical protein